MLFFLICFLPSLQLIKNLNFFPFYFLFWLVYILILFRSYPGHYSVNLCLHTFLLTFVFSSLPNNAIILQQFNFIYIPLNIYAIIIIYYLNILQTTKLLLFLNTNILSIYSYIYTFHCPLFLPVVLHIHLKYFFFK